MSARTALLALAFAAGMPATASAADGDPGNASYWADSRRGWHFYEEPEPPAAAPASPPVPAAPPAAPKAPELLQFERLQQSLEDTRRIAIIAPTDANVRRYMALEATVVGQASRFADVAQRLAWSTPALDPTLHGRPVNAKALDVFEQDQGQARARTVAALAHDHVLLFFFRGDCPYCHAFAPTLQAFQAKHGLTVVAVSLDGGALPGFAAPRVDNGIARTLNVTQVPALFLAQPFSGRIAPVGFGVLSDAQLLERIALVSAAAPDAAITIPSPSLR